MAKPLFSNNASGTLAGSYSAAATAITLTSGQGARFPSPTGGDYFMATIVDAFNNIEIVKVTARTTDTMTVVRAQEGTTARALGAGEKFECRLTAGALAAVRDKQAATADIADAAVTTPKLADGAVTAQKAANGIIDAATKLADGVVTAVKLATDAALGNLGFTPLEQGGGAGQTTDKVHIGWTLLGKLALTVGITDLGFILTELQNGGVKTAGYRGMPQNPQNANYAIGLSDAGGHVYHTAGTHQYTVPADATPFQEGNAVLIINDGGTLTIAGAGGVTLVWDATGLTGVRTLAPGSMATVIKVAPNRWYISGGGLS